MKARSAFILFCLPAVFAICCCNAAQAQDMDTLRRYAAIENTDYRNSYFNFRLRLPDWWYVHTEAEMVQAKKMARKQIETLPAAEKKMKMQEMDGHCLLLVISRYSPYRNLDFNATMMVNAALKSVTAATTVQSNLEDMVKEIVVQHPGMTAGPITPVDVDGKQVHRVDLQKYEDWLHATVRMRIYCFASGDFFLTFNMTYETERDL